jgi:hypothetical protein
MTRNLQALIAMKKALLVAGVLAVCVVLATAAGIPTLLSAQDTVIVAAAADSAGAVLPALSFQEQLQALFIKYQYPIAAALATVLVYLASFIRPVAALGDWSKRGLNALAAAIVLAAVRWIGGEASPELLEMGAALLVGAVAASGPTALAFRLSRTQPNAQPGSLSSFSRKGKL